MDEIEQQPGASGTPGPGGARHRAGAQAWNGDDDRLAQFSGVVGEIGRASCRERVCSVV